ncbi:LNS2 and lipin domain protein [Metarhizium robertsii]|uniref:Nuclear elongation and deformation protein 1 n=2 Tax=Metarhizium robertsii TaxID=568076 RepID=E9EMK5_METRA|nr:nuclear elongation and deformation protein 1 [Metarhizium robertsii ARSEF 23]EFZ03638.1 nuclear elongation and deformation protein 1 [Metarhizium robertsii ARSEF 23]EXV01998.1 LNS2 and lipin domain protein [Metarhizium robertsii]
MQYVRNLSDSVSTAWNSINPATLSGAIDVIVVQHEDGSLTCSPFHVRFGKFSLLRPSEKKVEFKVNGLKQEYSMKLGEGGEAFFVFETTENVPASLQTSPLVSPVSSPGLGPEEAPAGLNDPDILELDQELSNSTRPPAAVLQTQPDENGMMTPLSASPNMSKPRPMSGDWTSSLTRPHSDDVLRQSARAVNRDDEDESRDPNESERSHSPPPLGMERARTLAKELSAVNIPSRVTETGDLMLDMTGFKSSEEDMLQAEILARKILSEELEGNYDIGSLFGFDEEGNLWIYSSEEAKQAAMNKTIESSLKAHRHNTAADAVSDPGYHSDGSDVTTSPHVPSHRRSESDAGPSGLQTPPRTPPGYASNPNVNYAKTLRLTSDQLKALDLKPGENSMSFTVNRATCAASMYLWNHETPVVISDIDGTITKSDALGHVLNMIGRDWTHTGIAKLYSDIAQNGYNIMYLTSRSVGQSDTTRAYVNGIVQDGCRMPHGPTILSPDRTMAALRREVYLRQPHVFKMATLRDISSLYGPDHNPFYAGFGNRLTDQISYRTVNVPRTRIFTINSNSEVSLDLLSLNKLKMSYVNINEVVDHYFPPVATLVKGGGEDYTDFKYWRDEPLELDEFSASDSEELDVPGDNESTYTVDDDEEIGDGLVDSYISRESIDESVDDDNVENDEEYDEDDEEGEYEEDDAGSDDEAQLVDHMARSMISSKGVEEDIGAELITGLSGNGVAIESQEVYVEEPVEIRPTPTPTPERAY